jgi:hypothetical protein
MFSLCIPTMNRFDNFLSKYIPLYLNNSLISEIVICDENGNDINKINQAFPNNSKLKLFKNEVQLGPFKNKLKACSNATNEWIVLIDSDNFADYHYFQIAKNYINQNIKVHEKNIILAPAKALPNFNYSHLAGMIFKKGKFNENRIIENKNMNNTKNISFTQSEVLMNTGNYVLNKYLINNINLNAEIEQIKLSSACDVIYFNTLLFEQLDLNMHIVENLEYSHVVHDGSIYVQTHNNFRQFNEYVYQRYRSLL